MKRSAILIMVLVLAGFTSAFAAQQEKAQTKPPVAQQQVKPREVKMDRNYDGVIDRTEVYDPKGIIIRVETDTNGDQKIDEWVYYEAGVPVKGEKDINADGKPDTVIVYDLKGIVIRTEADSNGDGKIDEWVYYEAGKPVKAEKDINKDGKPDTWINY